MKDTLIIKTATGVTYTLKPVPMPFFPSSSWDAWLLFQREHVPGTSLSEETQNNIQRYMIQHKTEALTDGKRNYTLAGGMLAYCDPSAVTGTPS